MANNAKIINFPEREAEPQEQLIVKADIDKGFYKVARELGQALCKTVLSDRESRLLEAVKLKTWGFNKAMDWVCNEQLAELTDISLSNISKVKRSLLNRKILLKDGKKIGINPVISEWQKKSEPTIKKSEQTLQKSESTTGVVSSDPHKRKDTITKDNRSMSAKNFTDEDMTAAQYFLHKILDIKPNFKKPKLDSWANDIRLIRERDGKTHREICELFKWANNDNFWQANILSPKKLRAKWDELEIKSKSSACTANQIDYDDTSWAEGLEVELS